MIVHSSGCLLANTLHHDPIYELSRHWKPLESMGRSPFCQHQLHLQYLATAFHSLVITVKLLLFLFLRFQKLFLTLYTGGSIVYMNAGTPRGARSHGVRITCNCEPLDMNAGNSGPVEEQYMSSVRPKL